MKRTKISVLILISLFMTPAIFYANDSTTEQWTNKLIPLPKQIKVTESRFLWPNEIALHLPKEKDVRIHTAGKILQPFASGSSGFEIKLALTSDRKNCPRKLRKALAKLKNKDQAYVIEPITKSRKFEGLLLVANEPVGLLYAARTLHQLLTSSSNKQLEIPKVSILDWPDLEERGEWGWNLLHDRYSIAELKMNEIEIHSILGFNDDGTPSASLDKHFLAESQRIGIKVVPIIKHLEQLGNTGMFKYHPEVAAVFEPGKELPSDYLPAVCFSNPKSIELIAGWMCQLLDYPEVNDINAWLAETPAPCFCDQCRGRNTYELQTESLIRAFDQAKKEHPGSHMRILLSQASYNDNDKVLAAATPETRITYYSGQTTYDSSHEPMIYPLLEKYSRSGGWLGVYPQLTNSWRTMFPFTGSHFIRARMNEFVDKGLHSLSGYATPANCYYDFNIAATAEWGWNSKGRTERQFSEAYATRIGIKQPKVYAEWADIIGQVGWNLAGSRVVESFIFSAGWHIFVDGFIEDGVFFSKDKPIEYGKGILKEFETSEKLDNNIADTERALQIAVKADEPLIILESKAVLNTLLFVKNIKQFVDTYRQVDSAGKLDNLAQQLDTIDDIAKTITIIMGEWGALVNPAEQEALHTRFRDSVDFASNIAGQLRGWVKYMDITDPIPTYRFKAIGEWDTVDFEKTDEITVWADITDHIQGAGEHDVRLFFLEGASGVSPTAVTLLSGPTTQTAQVVFTDRWESRLSRYGRYIEYWINVPGKPRNLANALDRYFIKAEIKGPSLDLPQDRRTTKGEILIRKSWRDANE